MTLPKTWVDGEVLYAPDLNTNFTYVDTATTNIGVPIGGIISWAKTHKQVDSGTANSTLSFKLIQTTQNFLTTVSAGNLVHNTTDNTFAYVVTVDSDTTLTIDTDIMSNGKAYVIYATPALSSSFVECNGQTLSDPQSVYDGAIIPNLNGTTDATKRFLRGARTSGATGGIDTHVHSITTETKPIWNNIDDANETYGSTSSTGSAGTLPPYYEVVFIMRVK